MNNIKNRIFQIIQIGNKEDVPSRLCDYLLVITITLNLGILFFSTFDFFKPFLVFAEPVEWVTVIIFIIEYILRIWTATQLYKMGSIKSRLRYIFSFDGLVCLLTLLPYFLPFVFPSGIIAFRTLRVFRVFHLFRINAQYDAFNVVIDVLKEKKNQLFSTTCLILILMLASSICMYNLEHEAQPEIFKNAFSGIWWSVSTLLTVGYGDIYPITVAGRIFAIIIAFLGVGMVALPTGIISAGFVEHYTKVKSQIKNIDTIAGEMKYLMIDIEKDHPWSGKKISELDLPPELSVMTVLRKNNVISVDENFKIHTGDHLVICKNSL